MAIDPTSNLDMAYFRAPETRTIVTNTLGKGVVSMTHVRAREALGFIDDHVVEDAVMIAYQHRTLDCDLFLESQHVPVPGQGVDNVTLYDYRCHWNCEIKSGFAKVVASVLTSPRMTGSSTVSPGITTRSPEALLASETASKTSRGR
jgi:hypothetical protein